MNYETLWKFWYTRNVTVKNGYRSIEAYRVKLPPVASLVQQAMICCQMSLNLTHNMKQKFYDDVHCDGLFVVRLRVFLWEQFKPMTTTTTRI